MMWISACASEKKGILLSMIRMQSCIITNRRQEVLRIRKRRSDGLQTEIGIYREVTGFGNVLKKGRSSNLANLCKFDWDISN